MKIEFQGQACFALTLPTGERAVVALHGAQVISWQTKDGTERLYLSPKALFDGRSAIRGGMPICFPQFNQRILEGRALPKHGFARTLSWSVLESTSEAQFASIKLGLDQDDLPSEIRTVWPFQFKASLTVCLEPGRLRVTFDVLNQDTRAWPFALALHSYFKVPAIAETALEGLKDVHYWDAVQDLPDPEKTQAQLATDLSFSAETDRVYQNAPPALTLKTTEGSLKIEQSDSFSETVVWNPGEPLCAQLSDMPAEGYRHMLCVEAAKIKNAISLAPGACWRGSQTLSV